MDKELIDAVQIIRNRLDMLEKVVMNRIENLKKIVGDYLELSSSISLASVKTSLKNV